MGDKSSEAARFLTDLFGDAPCDDARIALWTKSSQKTDYLDGAADGAKFEGRPDVYVHASLASQEALKGKRPTNKHSAGIPGVWADIDVKGGPDDAPGKLLAETVDDAMEVANAVLTPTLIVHSGYGLQAWWLLEEPWVFGNADEQGQAARMVQGFQRLLRNFAFDRSWGLDSTHDLARLMRLPGTLNDKGPDGTQKPVRILEEDGPRYAMEEIAGKAMAAAPAADPAGRIKISEKREFSMRKFEALKANSEKFEPTWEHTRRGRDVAGWSMSHYDLALASMAVNAGWTDDEVAELVAEHRRKHNGRDDEKAARVDYLQRTLAKAHNNSKTTERQENQEAAVDELAEMAENPNGVVDPSRAISLFNEIISSGREGAPVIKEVIQYGTEPEDARYVFMLANGNEINVGEYANLRSTRKLDERIAPSTGFVMTGIKEDERWVLALTALLRIAQIREEGEDKTREWVRSYTEDRLGRGATKHEAAREGEPFAEDGFVYVKTAPLIRYIKGVMRERLSHADLAPLLKKAGFEQSTVHFDKDEGKRTTASYWRISKDDLV